MIWYLYVLQNGYCNKFSYCPHHSSYNFFLVIRNFKIYSLLLFSCSVILNSVTSWTAALPGFAILHYLLDFAQTHVHWISDTMQPSNPLSPSFPPALNLSQHQDLFQWVGSLHQVAKVLELQLQPESVSKTRARRSLSTKRAGKQLLLLHSCSAARKRKVWEQGQGPPDFGDCACIFLASL